jgi:ribonuclease P protein component
VAKQFTLGKNERLTSRKQIEQLFSEGKKISVFPFYVYYRADSPAILPGSLQTVQFGVGVSARNFKRAVDRNRIKRLIREAYRLQKQDLLNAVSANNMHLSLFFIYTAKEANDFRFIYDKMTIALQKMISAVERERGK